MSASEATRTLALHVGGAVLTITEWPDRCVEATTVWDAGLILAHYLAAGRGGNCFQYSFQRHRPCFCRRLLRGKRRCTSTRLCAHQHTSSRGSRPRGALCLSAYPENTRGRPLTKSLGQGRCLRREMPHPLHEGISARKRLFQGRCTELEIFFHFSSRFYLLRGMHIL